jgi:hypothetical protein
MAISTYDVKRLTLEDDSSDTEELLYNFKVGVQFGDVHSWRVLLFSGPNLKILLLQQMPVGSQEAGAFAHVSSIETT